MLQWGSHPPPRGVEVVGDKMSLNQQGAVFCLEGKLRVPCRPKAVRYDREFQSASVS